MEDSLECDLNFIYQPLSLHREKYLRLLSKHCEHGSVLDLGCGGVGHYWALAYSPLIDQIVLSDKNPDMIDQDLRRIEKLDPTTITTLYPGTFELLAEVSPGHSPAERVLSLHHKITDCKVIDCVNGPISNPFNYILANELFENLGNLQEVLAALKNIGRHLTPGGKLLGTSLVADDSSLDTVALRIPLEQFDSFCSEVGFTCRTLEVYNPAVFGYGCAYSFVMEI